MASLYILVEVVGVSGNVFIEPCQLHLMLFIIPLIYCGQFKTKLQWLNAFWAHSEWLTCNFGGIEPQIAGRWAMSDGWRVEHCDIMGIQYAAVSTSPEEIIETLKI